MRRYQNQVWSQFDPETFTLDPRFEDPLGAVYEDMEFVGCKVRGGGLGERARRPEDRTVVRRVRATKCMVHVDVGPVLFEDIDVEDLRTGSALWLRAALFKHVTLRGKMGNWVLTDQRWASSEPEEQAAFDASAVAFYDTIDWALDISQAHFSSLDWRLRLPAHLVRRDPETQIVVKRESALAGAWRQLPLDPLHAIGLNNFLQFDLTERILVASRGSKRFKEELASIRLLRQEGIAEPDEQKQ